MNIQQILRIDKIYYESIYLLNKTDNIEGMEFDIAGSTNNIYKIQINFLTRKIICNCPDAKGWCKKNNIICKHCCFILLKVLKFLDYENYFKILIFTENEIDFLKNNFNNLNIQNDNSFINNKYIKRFKELNNTKHNSIILKDDYDKNCVICYDNINDITNIVKNTQCKCCYKIFHKKCIQKWIDIGKNTCPHCRNFINITNDYKNLFT